MFACAYLPLVPTLTRCMRLSLLAVWQDRESRFDVSNKDLECRSGESVIDDLVRGATPHQVM